MAKNILIVEDDAMLSTIFEIYLTELGYNHRTAKSAEKAIQLCKENRPDVILMDFNIDGSINGIDTNRIIKTDFNIPVIYISSDLIDDIMEKGIIENVYGYLIKPLYKNNLKSTIEFAFKKHALKN